jgi:hypothetical protein
MLLKFWQTAVGFSSAVGSDTSLQKKLKNKLSNYRKGETR